MVPLPFCFQIRPLKLMHRSFYPPSASRTTFSPDMCRFCLNICILCRSDQRPRITFLASSSSLTACLQPPFCWISHGCGSKHCSAGAVPSSTDTCSKVADSLVSDDMEVGDKAYLPGPTCLELTAQVFAPPHFLSFRSAGPWGADRAPRSAASRATAASSSHEFCNCRYLPIRAYCLWYTCTPYIVARWRQH